MKTELEETGAFERTLTLTVDAAAWEAAGNRAARRLSRDIKVKGFRPGKAPRRMVESMVGPERMRSETLEMALPEILVDVLREQDLRPAVAPAVTDTRDTPDGVEVDLRITLWPEPGELPDYEGRRIEVDAVTVDEDELTARIDQIRDQFAELDETENAADSGSYVLIDVTVPGDGEPVSLGQDLMYEVGSKSHLPGLDEALIGAKAGHIREVESTFDGDDVTARVLVKGVRVKRLPELTDEWVTDVTEFGGLDELRAAVGGDLESYKRRAGAAQLRAQLLEALVAEMDLLLPEALIEAETEDAIHRFVHSLEAQEIDIPTYFQVTGQDEATFLDDQRRRADIRLRTRIFLDSVAAAEGLEVDDDTLSGAVEELASRADTSSDEFRARLESAGQVEALRGDILREKALDHLVGCATAVDAAGDPVALEEPDPTEDEAQPAEVD